MKHEDVLDYIDTLWESHVLLKAQTLRAERAEARVAELENRLGKMMARLVRNPRLILL